MKKHTHRHRSREKYDKSSKQNAQLREERKRRVFSYVVFASFYVILANQISMLNPLQFSMNICLEKCISHKYQIKCYRDSSYDRVI